jgi:transcriptional regulator with XRE-family HTH domain
MQDPQQFRETLAQELMRLRLRKKLMQKTLASRAGLSTNGYHRYERAQRDIPVHTLIRICVCLGTKGSMVLKRVEKKST